MILCGASAFRWAVAAVIFAGLVYAAEPPLKVSSGESVHGAIYVSSLESAEAEAKRTGRRILLYTGRAQFCPGNDPRKHFFGTLVADVPALKGALAELVVCERFIYPEIFTRGGGVTDGFRREMTTGGFYALHEKYDLRYFQPLLTVIDAEGSKVAGPFGAIYGNLDKANEFFAKFSAR